MTVAGSELVSPSLQPVSNPPDMSRWNPFGEDNFSKLTEEELLDREFDLLRASKCYIILLCYLGRPANLIAFCIKDEMRHCNTGILCYELSL